MIELDKEALKILRNLEIENMTNYEIYEIKIKDDIKSYIHLDKLLTCLEDTQYSRYYAEERLKELANSIDGGKQ